MANNVTTIIDTAQGEVEREEHLFMMECFDACEEAKQNERMLRMELNNARVKLERLHTAVYGAVRSIMLRWSRL